MPEGSSVSSHVKRKKESVDKVIQKVKMEGSFSRSRFGFIYISLYPFVEQIYPF